MLFVPGQQEHKALPQRIADDAKSLAAHGYGPLLPGGQGQGVQLLPAEKIHPSNGVFPEAVVYGAFVPAELYIGNVHALGGQRAELFLFGIVIIQGAVAAAHEGGAVEPPGHGLHHLIVLSFFFGLEEGFAHLFLPGIQLFKAGGHGAQGQIISVFQGPHLLHGYGQGKGQRGLAPQQRDLIEAAGDILLILLLLPVSLEQDGILIQILEPQFLAPGGELGRFSLPVYIQAGSIAVLFLLDPGHSKAGAASFRRKGHIG